MNTPKLGRCYIAGRMTGVPDWNFPAFHKVAAQFREQGFEVINPAEHFDGDTTLAWEVYLKHDIGQLVTCDTLVLLPGWEQSEGARLEAHVANKLKFDIIDPDHNRVEVPDESTAKLDAFVAKVLAEKPQPEHWFNAHANEIHEETYSILNERAGEYSDSWRSMQFVFMQLALRQFGVTLTYDQVRILGLAGLCDTKLSRIQTGEFKPDSHIDFNNYNAAFTSALREHLHGV